MCQTSATSKGVRSVPSSPPRSPLVTCLSQLPLSCVLCLLPSPRRSDPVGAFDHTPAALAVHLSMDSARLHRCPADRFRPTTSHSHKRRDFWVKNYSAVKSANSSLPILLRECAGTSAKLTAAYRECPSCPDCPCLSALPHAQRVPVCCGCRGWQGAKRERRGALRGGVWRQAAVADEGTVIHAVGIPRANG